MPSAQHQQSFSFPGYSFNNNEAAVTFDHPNVFEIALAALHADNTGTLDERVDDNTGFANLGASHTISDGDTVDVYWSGGVRYGMTASASGGDVTIDGGAGDALPVLTTSITVCKQTEINPCSIDGDQIQIIGVFYRNLNDTGAKAHIDFQDSGSVSINELDLVHETANGSFVKGTTIVNVSGGDTNTYTGNPITKAFASHDSAQAATLFVLSGEDSTP
jgi:hypothetical protein